METTKSFLHPSTLAVTDVYTDLHGLQGLKNEEDQDQALKKVAQQFESLFVSMMIKSMRSANEVFENGNPFNSQESKFYRDMLDQQMSLSLSHGKGLGIADVLYRQLSKVHGAEEQGSNNTFEKKTIPQDISFYSSSNNRTTSNNKNENSFKNNSLNEDLNKSLEGEGINNKISEESNVKGTVKQGNYIFNSPEAFIRGIYQYAKKAAETLGTDTETIIAQSALETGWGKNIINDAQGNPSHNLFNIKSGAQWHGDSIGKTVVEYEKGTVIKEQAQFRKYNTFEQSFDDYVSFISQSSRYNKALDSDSGDEYITSLKEGGFATDPNYVEKVKSVRLKVVETLGDIVHDLLSKHIKGGL